jgi:hypothetical protein
MTASAITTSGVISTIGSANRAATTGRPTSAGSAIAT